MELIDNIIRETIDRFLLREYHHVTDDGLIQDVYAIYDGFVNMHKYGDTKRDMFRIPSLGRKVSLELLQGIKGAALVDYSQIILNLDEFEESLNDERARNHVLSLIYHELGHLVQYIKSDSKDVLRPTFKKPLFLSMSTEDYKAICRKLYCFQDRELKARLYGTYMWLKNNPDRNISIKRLYDCDECRLSMMSQFMEEIKQIASEGENGSRSFVIKNLYADTYRRNRMDMRSYNAPFAKQAERVVYFYQKRYDWFKKRVDKIYNDWKQNY